MGVVGAPTMHKRTYDVDLNKLVGNTFKFLRNHDVPRHWSRTKNEKYDVHLMIVLYVLFCMADKSYKRFKQCRMSRRCGVHGDAFRHTIIASLCSLAAREEETSA